MGNLYDYFMTLLGITSNTSGLNSNVIYCCCICVIVLFAVSIKIIFKGFSRLCGYNNYVK